MDENFKRRSNRGGLQTVLLRSCPPDLVDGSVSIPRLAEHIDLTPQGIYRWIRKGPRGKIPVPQARRIAALSEGRTTFEDFLDFL